MIPSFVIKSLTPNKDFLCDTKKKRKTNNNEQYVVCRTCLQFAFADKLHTLYGESRNGGLSELGVVDVAGRWKDLIEKWETSASIYRRVEININWGERGR